MNWIDEKIQSQGDIAQQQLSLPSRIQGLWGIIAKKIEHDVQSINNKNLGHLGQVNYISESWGHINIQKLACPAYYIDVKLDSEKPEITIEQKRVDYPDRVNPTKLQRFSFQYAGNNELVLVDKNKTVISVEQFSENVLGIILEG